MSEPKIDIVHREALFSLLQSGETYVTESEISAERIVTHYYRPGSEDAIARVTMEGPNVGTFTNLSQRLMCGDSGAQAEIQRLEAAASAH